MTYGVTNLVGRSVNVKTGGHWGKESYEVVTIQFRDSTPYVWYATPDGMKWRSMEDVRLHKLEWSGGII